MSVAVLNFSKACAFLSHIRVEIDTQPGDVNILCLQGTSLSNPGQGDAITISPNDNRPDRYNDLIVLFGPDGKFPDKYIVDAYAGTIDPGRYYTVKDPHPQGAAHLTFGQHLYRFGNHRGHPALRSLNETNRIWRDKNGNFRPDIGESVYAGVFGVNIHAGGSSESIGQNSAGCINIAGGWEGKDWTTFYRRCSSHLDLKPFVRVTLWRGSDYFLFEKEKTHHRPTLLLGMNNGWVAEMQRLLNSHGSRLIADGDWREKTTNAVVAFQAKSGLKEDGWCGARTWSALLK